MKRRQKAAWFLSGVAATVLAVSLTSPALAALAAKTIQVYTGVDVYVDDMKLEPTDANGNPVEVFVYNGTTYLPVRAVSEAVGKDRPVGTQKQQRLSGQAHRGEASGVAPGSGLLYRENIKGRAHG